MIVQFEESTPPAPGGAGQLRLVAAGLRARPGVWALLGVRGTPASAQQLAEDDYLLAAEELKQMANEAEQCETGGAS